MSLSLPSVTLLVADTINHRLALRALAICCQRVEFGRVVFLTDAIPAGMEVPHAVEVRKIERLASRDDYSQLLLKGLLPYVETTHVLIAQWDGYVVNPDAWLGSFLDHDYIGAKWFEPPPGFRVGNGGFSLRSRRLLEALQHPRIELRQAEDVTICQAFRTSLESGCGIRFADEDTADRFSYETTYGSAPAFGFHGLYNFCRVMDPSELTALVPLLSDDIAHSTHFVLLLRHCVVLQQWQPALAIGRRILALRPHDDIVHELMIAIDKRGIPASTIGRNERCPCGSGKRYKECHGIAAAGSSAQ